MKQEPVALVSVRYSNEPYVFSQLKTLPNGTHELYTAPRELSDEEILNVAFCCEVNTVAIENDWDGTVIDFAKAILKKASER
jgi:hypothetical protein